MTCSDYAVLLEKYLEDALTPEEEALMEAHEAACSACAAHRRTLKGLQEELACLEVPAMPEGFHQAWMDRVKEEPIVREQNRPHWTKTLTRMASVAAAAVFIIGGTLLTRDQLVPSALSRENAVQEEMAYDSGYSMNKVAADYDMASPQAAGGVGLRMNATSGVAREEKIIRNGSMTVGTQRYDESLAALKAWGEEKGWVTYLSESADSKGLRRAYVTLRVPAEELEQLMTDSGGLGRIIRREESATDVTDSYYDTQARLETQEALMARLQALVTDAASLSDLLALEAQIADTQYQIDSLKSSLEDTDQQVTYATLDVTLQEETSADLAAASVPLGERLRSAIATGMDAFVGFVTDAAVFLTAALPFIGTVAVVWIVVAVIRRARRKK